MSPKILTKNWDLEDSHKLKTSLQQGGYQALEKALKTMKSDEVVAEVFDSNLRGRGGAGFSAGQKWRFLPPVDGKPRYIVVNADEGEPGTFKDRFIIERDPHMLVEGIALAGYATQATDCYIYIRGEYREPKERLAAALREAEGAGYIGENILGSGYSLKVSVTTGAGAYICGEEMAMLESIEGKKGWPRLKPPFPATVGLFGRPTVINNVETIACLPSIVANGGLWFANLGTPGNGGTKLYAVSGHVERPGVVELLMGTPLRDVIEACGGIRAGKKLKAVIPGGVSAPVLTADEIDVPMDFTGMEEADSMLGSAAVIVMDEDTDMVKALDSIMGFFARESCGQCTPCREGTAWTHKMLRKILAGEGRLEDLDCLLDVAEGMDGTTIYPLGPAASGALRTLIRKFRGEFEEAIVRLGGSSDTERSE
ncbi:NADH-quinone oxidoreductase subunit NuoF [Candidatus Eisenbacteria bacterium]|uniref:NADH-quinone oxidoreductase subunit F n=1 Tax=Eiseniibacteriota bacterium TaxID=2212470 RepID=A0ABV6YJF1_UNCEI